MEIILVHWLIKKQKTEEFVIHWKDKMKPGTADGFYREILTRPISQPDPKFNTFSVTDENYATYINIGIWESLEHFERAIEKWFPKASTKIENNKTKQTIELEDFEFKIRERIVLKHLYDRGIDLPEPSIED